VAEIIQFTGQTKLDINPDAVLDGAKGQLTTVFVCEYEADGSLYFASSTAQTAEILFMLEKFKFKVMRRDFNADNN
jgi:hypothetical protein